MDNFTLEEIYLVKNCAAADKYGVVKELKSYLNHIDDLSMKEIIQNTVHKIYLLSEEEFVGLDFKNYPDDQV